MKVAFLTLTLVLSIAADLQGQIRNYLTEKDNWYEGSIHLRTGETVKGELNYNFVTDRVTMKGGSNRNTYFAGNVLSFEYLDDTENKITFISIPYVKQGSNFAVPIFFQFLFENGKLALLSRNDFEHKVTSGNTVLPDPNVPRIVTKEERVSRIIYIANKDNQILPFLIKVVDKSNALEKLVQPMVFNSSKPLKESSTEKEVSKYKYANKDALKILAADEYPALKKHAKDNDLDPKRLEDLMALLSAEL